MPKKNSNFFINQNYFKMNFFYKCFNFSHLLTRVPLLVMALLLSSTGMIGQVVIIGNYSSTDDNSSSGIGLNSQKAVKFTMPAGTGYFVSTLELRLEDAFSNGAPAISLRNDDAVGDNPGTEFVTFDNPTLADAKASYTFTPASSTTLQANTSYWILVDHADNSNDYIWLAHAGGAGGITPSGIATYGNYRWSTNNGVSYSNSSYLNSFQLNGMVLPVELTIFKAEKKSASVLLIWQTASEENNKGFDIQRSADGKKWDSIGWIEGHGTSLEQQKYQYLDGSVRSGQIYYYRLKQMDFDGVFEYSKVIAIEPGSTDEENVRFYPLPVKDQLVVEFTTSNEDELQIILSDLTGRSLITQQVRASVGINQYYLEMNNLPPGTYFARLYSSRTNTVETVVKQ